MSSFDNYITPGSEIMATLPKATSGLNTNYMEINWTIVIIVTIAAIALIYYFIRQNQKDEKKMEQEMNDIAETGNRDHEDDDDTKRL